MIYIPKISGTCRGAMNAINIAYDLVKKNSKKKVYILKEILHNNQIIEDLRVKGIECIDNIDSVDRNSIIIIRAHGEPKSLYDELNKRKIEYYDATCINVKNIHDKVFKKANDGYKIIIIGKREHPEVIGTLGWCKNNGIVIENENDLNNLKFGEKDKLYVVSQTTISKEHFEHLSKIINSKYKNAEILNSICTAQKAIQDSSSELAKDMDIMFVIGGANSSNTEELFQRCSLVCKSYKFSNIEEFYNWNMKTNLDLENIKIGITGGASTPHSQINEYKNLLEFIIFYKKMKPLFESEIRNVNNSFKINNDNKLVKDVVNNFIDINKDGKYIRATLIALGYKMGSNNLDNVFLPLALAYETFQTSILIHDDIIDNAKLRRGKETIPTRYNKKFKIENESKSYKAEKSHISDSIGICAGDLGFYLSNKIIFDNYKDNKNLNDVFSYYNEIVINTIKGELIDVILPFKAKYKLSTSKEKDVMEIYHLKTAYYTIIGPFILGLKLSGYNKNLDIIESILDKVGIAFQIKDDIIGIFSSKDTLGKSNQSDINEFKQTILYTYILKDKKYKDELDKYYGKGHLKEKELDEVKNIFISSNALKYANDKMLKLLSEAYDEIKNANFMNDEIKNILLGLITYLKFRNK